MKKFSEILVRKMDLPVESIIGLPQISMCGDGEVAVEGFKRVLEYTDTAITLGCGRIMIEISGVDLCIKSFTKNCLLATGKIFSVGFRE